MSEVERILREARDRVARGWTQGAWARDAKGKHCQVNDPNAVSWDVYGALGLGCGGKPKDANWWEACRRVEVAAGTIDLGEWNEKRGRTQEEAVALFDKALTI